MRNMLLIISIIPLLYLGLHFTLQRMAIDQYVKYKMGIRVSDVPSWQEIAYMKLQGFEINILYKLGLIKPSSSGEN